MTSIGLALSVQWVPKIMLGFWTGANGNRLIWINNQEKETKFVQTFIDFNVSSICCSTNIRKIIDIKLNAMCFVASLVLRTKGPCTSISYWTTWNNINWNTSRKHWLDGCKSDFSTRNENSTTPYLFFVSFK